MESLATCADAAELWMIACVEPSAIAIITVVTPYIS